jgi:hypothetical protein
MIYPARIDWHPKDYNEQWNHMLARCVEVFGLPGDRYTTYVDANYMDFLFRNEQDRLLFLTGWPSYIPKDQGHGH